MSNYVLDRAYRVEEAAGVARYRAVVAGNGNGTCRYPAGANAGGVLGISMHAQTHENKAVTVRRLGIAPCEAAGPVAVGSYVCVAGNDGRIKEAVPPSAVTDPWGAENGMKFTALAPAPFTPLERVEIVVAGTETEFSAEFAGGTATVNVATDAGGAPTIPATQLTGFLNDHPVLSHLMKSELHGGSGLLPPNAGTYALTGHAESINPIGIAQESATSEGDIVDVLLTP